ncbi:senescence-induced receptor-like serine/threonine-protein kinase [Malania oleifera]|uniref:senescence-induced receptor-like serine/threonine-protein kinase n=1 Tax=Malania oleifera TaxID=397392 RepID=UPI0025AE80F2|nr:senescence-induced receptor-like serine/threonine-protein kinase [Malania oleifera]
MVGILMGFLLALLGGFALSAVHAQDQPGFLSIDCGISENAGYVDAKTGINYISDASFTDTGSAKSVSPAFQTNSTEQQFLNVRSFPQGTKNCYKLNPPRGKGTKYFIRARFMYGNYDSKGQLPQFDLHLGVNVWDSVKLENASTIVNKEIIHVLTSDSIYVCLVDTGLGTPFISALELRLLNNSIYTIESGSLVNILRLDFGSSTKEFVRYKDDIYDRIWSPPVNSASWGKLSTQKNIDTNSGNMFRPPVKVMQTAFTALNNSKSFRLYWVPDDPSFQVYFYMYFSEIQELKANQFREFNLYLNGNFWNGPFVPNYLYTNTLYTTSAETQTDYSITFNQTDNSTLPPIINAFEIYRATQLFQSETVQDEVDAVVNIKSMYGVKKNWQGDPCVPKAYLWDGLNCTYDGYNPPRVTSLNLSSSGLRGLIAPYISNLTMIQFLDLSNNSLTGSVPAFLPQLTFLRVLNLAGNNFTGSIPAELVEKSRNGSLSMSVDANLCSSLLCNTTTITKDNNSNNNKNNDNNSNNNNKFVVPVVASIAALLIILGALAIFWFPKRRQEGRKMGRVETESPKKDGPLEAKKRQFTYSEVLSITNNFERVIGRGGFGTVYHGYLDDSQVAVKMLSLSSAQGYDEFRNEAELLMRVHHRNLTSLVGYCNDRTNLGLIYEYMANGNLGDYLADTNVNALSWEERLRIAIDAAQGLEYLHNGCKPIIVHRDVKSSNILLNKEFQAKIADFGLSRAFLTEGDTHVSTRVIGTLGYLDPVYRMTNWLNEKSDVYSFGVVLLEIITSRPAIGKDAEKTHIIQWVRPLLENGDVRNIVDPRLPGEININSVWKAVELAMACVSPAPAKRPTMSDVVKELKECLALKGAWSRE